MYYKHLIFTNDHHTCRCKISQCVFYNNNVQHMRYATLTIICCCSKRNKFVNAQIVSINDKIYYVYKYSVLI